MMKCARRATISAIHCANQAEGMVVRCHGPGTVAAKWRLIHTLRLASVNRYCPRVSGASQVCDVLDGTATTFHLRSQAPQRVYGEDPPMGIEGNHVREGVRSSGGALSNTGTPPPVSSAAQTSLVCTIRSRIWRRLCSGNNPASSLPRDFCDC